MIFIVYWKEKEFMVYDISWPYDLLWFSVLCFSFSFGLISFLHKSKSPFLMISLMLLDLDTIFWTIKSKGATNFDAMLNTEASHFSNVSSVGKQSCKSNIKHDHRPHQSVYSLFLDIFYKLFWNINKYNQIISEITN